jgi:TolB-like protein
MKRWLFPALAGFCLAIGQAAGEESSLPPAASGDRPTAVVLDFSNQAGPDYDYLSKKGADKLQALLGRTGLFRIIDRSRIEGTIAAQGAGGIEGETAAVAVRMAEKAGADYAVLGLFRDAGQESRRYQGEYGAGSVNLLFTLDTVVRIVDSRTGEILWTDEAKSELTIRESPATEVEKTNIYDDLAEKGLSALIERLSEKPPSGPRAPRPAGKAIAVSVASQPPGGDILIDGIMRGNTPAEITVEPGLHAIEIRRDGYLPWKTSFTPETLTSLNPALTLAPPPPDAAPAGELIPLELKKKIVTDEYEPRGGSEQ